MRDGVADVSMRLPRMGSGCGSAPLPASTIDGGEESDSGTADNSGVLTARRGSPHPFIMSAPGCVPRPVGGYRPGMGSTPVTPLPRSKQRGDVQRFRPDIEGLRAFALILMLLFHAGVPFAGGGYVGLDVFFVISGFLITALIVAEIEATGRLALGAFYARRARRLLPLAFTVIAASAVAAVIVFDPVRREEAGADLVAAGAYVINWVLHLEAVDYFAADAEPNLVQHYWSLSVEEQFYLLWPLLLILAATMARRFGLDRRTVLVGVVLAVLVAGLTHAIHTAYTAEQPGYFSTAVRGWEFAFGGALALGVLCPGRLTIRSGALCAWAGMALLLGSFLIYTPSTRYPGTAVIVPVLGTALIILGGSVRRPALPIALLQARPMRHMGRVSYAWYLWHWPMIVIATELWGELTALQGTFVVTAAYLPALLSHRWVEEPFRPSRVLAAAPRRGLGLGLACTAGCVAVGLVIGATTPRVQVAESPVAGAAAGIDRARSPDEADRASDRSPPSDAFVQATSAGVRPEPRDAADDLTRAHRDHCLVGQTRDELADGCVYGNRESPTTVVMYGDSHMIQYFPALQVLARQNGWRLRVVTKAACPPADVLVWNSSLNRPYDRCVTWRGRVLEMIERERPAMVIASGVTTNEVIRDGRRLTGATNAAELQAGFAREYQRLAATGTRVVAITAYARPRAYLPGCVARQGLQRLNRCAARIEDMTVGPRVDRAAAEQLGVRVVNPRPRLCRNGVCPAVIGDAIVYRRAGHLTATFAETLAPWLRTKLPRLS